MAAPSPPAELDDPVPEPGVFEPALTRDLPPRAAAAIRRLLWLLAALGLGGMLWIAHALARAPVLEAGWSAGADGRLVLESSPLPALRPHLGSTVLAVGDGALATLPVDALLLHRWPRWQVDDAARRRQLAQHEGLATLLAAGPVQLHLSRGATPTLAPRERGWSGIGWGYWPLASLALALLLAAAAVLARPRRLNLMYLVMAACQSAQLMLAALAATPGLPLPGPPWVHDLVLRAALDGATAAAAVSAFALHPHRLPRAWWIVGGAWGIGLAWLVAAAAGLLAPTWWWTQGLTLGLVAAAVAVMAWSCRTAPDPLARVLRRLASAALAALALLTIAVALAATEAGTDADLVAAAALAWTLFPTALLLLTPFLARSRHAQREFVLLAGVGTVAMSLNLLLGAAFALHATASLPLALGVAMVLYAVARQWLIDRVVGRNALGTERTFELLYRAARELQAHPARQVALLQRLLRDLFEPLQLGADERVPERARVVGGGSALVVPLRGSGADAAPVRALVLRHAQQGQRLFTIEDALLADRLAEQLRRVAASERAVEQARHEERLRIAQDLHDDIGARLLTLMYQAPTPEIEDYIRHTLQDLKTLTRGLAASEHRLSHAAVEWKSDLTHRLAAAQAELQWSCHADLDVRLSVVQWSALTRVLRELVSNALYHGHAGVIEVQIVLERGQLLLRVADDGCGRDPASWSHGLGLGGVRKRVKLLGGEVHWLENRPAGIVCEVRAVGFHGTA